MSGSAGSEVGRGHQDGLETRAQSRLEEVREVGMGPAEAISSSSKLLPAERALGRPVASWNGRGPSDHR